MDGQWLQKACSPDAAPLIRTRILAEFPTEVQEKTLANVRDTVRAILEHPHTKWLDDSVRGSISCVHRFLEAVQRVAPYEEPH